VDLTGLEVLLVEDETDGRELMAEILSAAGARVTAAASVREAMTRFEESRPSIVVSDIGMPKEDGYALIRRIRRHPQAQGGNVPAIAVTAYAREEDRLRALSAGFQAHVAKPVDPADLLRAVARMAGLPVAFAPHRATPIAVASPGPSPEPAPPAHPACGQGEDNGHSSLPRVLIVEDDDDSREGLRSLLEVWGHAVEVAETGSAGVRMAISGRPAVVLIDIGLPEEDGYAVARRIREALGHEATYLVAMTGYASADDRRRALEGGFDAHVGKPIDFGKLSSLLAARVLPTPATTPGDSPVT
jgi:CheY-like chemotaxis protein